MKLTLMLDRWCSHSELTLLLYDYGARFYDPQIGKWMTIDLFAQLSKKLSPYVYCFDNPIKYVDNDGKYPTKKIAEGSILGDRFAPRIHPLLGILKPHQGQDFIVKSGSNIRAAAEGVITNIGCQFDVNKGTGWGYYVEITHSGGIITRYAHLLYLSTIKMNGNLSTG